MSELKAELHCHTWHSKGGKIKVEGLHSPEEMVRHASNIGLDAVAITDHDVFEGALEAEKISSKYNVTVIKGEEITTDQDRHVIGLGLTECIPKGLLFEEVLDRIHAQGGIAIAPHPFDINNKGIGRRARHCDAVEAFNSINKDRFSNRKAKKLAKKFKLNIVAGSDAHAKEMIGFGRTLIEAEKSEEAILKAIKKGNTRIHSRYVPGTIIKQWSLHRINHSYADIVQYIAENYDQPKKIVCEKLLGLTKKSPGRVDYFFSGLLYVGLASATMYSMVKTPFRN